MGAQYSCSARHLLRAIQSNSKPASFFHHHVRHVFTADTPINDIQKILSVCTGIQNLLISIHVESIIPTIAALRPRRLSLFWLYILDYTNPRQPMFSFLTHFHMLDFLSVAMSTVPLPSFLAQLPVLTHFAAFWNPPVGDGFPAVAREILTACEALRVFVLHPPWEPKLQSLASNDDVRVVYMHLGRGYRHRDGWLAQTRGGIDFWARADAFVEKKRYREIQPTSRCWIEPADGIPEFDGF
ncbi:hypothetical protein B0H14DRAFT_357494 [Mycena olivaceomarginata]|nr:hypothetical protein B0H14DRAFT_357494 [Mycena olivaceomarginata]